MTLRLRCFVAKLSDVPAITALVNSAYRGESSRAGWTTEADLLGGQRVDEDGISSIVSSSTQTIIAASPEGSAERIACVQLSRNDDGVYLGMLTTKPTLQGGGIGKQLLAYAETLVRSWGCKRIYMSVIEQRRELVEFYQRRGYRDTGHKKPFPYGDVRLGLPTRDDLCFIIMDKFLDD